MGKYWRVIGHYNGEATTFEALAGTFQASPYVPDEKSRLHRQMLCTQILRRIGNLQKNHAFARQ